MSASLEPINEVKLSPVLNSVYFSKSCINDLGHKIKTKKWNLSEYVAVGHGMIISS